MRITILSTRIIPGLLIILSVSLWPVGCTKKTVTDPTTGQSTTQVVVTDDTLHQITVQVRRAIEGVQAIGAIKRGLFKQHTITAAQSRAVTTASQQALAVLNDINTKVAGYSDLDEASRAELKRLTATALSEVTTLTGVVTANIHNSEAQKVINTINDALQVVQRLTEGG